MAVTYTPTTNFGAKDSLPQNDPDKVIKGSEFTTEFTALQTAFSLAAPNASPTFTGTVTIPTADINGGAIDGTVIGAATPAAGSFTTGQFSTSLNVDGTVTADGLTVSDTAGTVATFGRVGSNGVYLNLSDNSGSNVYLGNSGGQFQVQTAGASYASKLTVESNGDISFYEDTGTTPKFFWDASAEALGIGTSSLTSNASLSIAQGGVHVDGGASGGASQVILSTGASSGSNFGQISNTGTRWSLGYGGTQQTVGTEVLTWNSSGNVGIGTSSPSSELHVKSSGTSSDTLTIENSTGNGSWRVKEGGSSNALLQGYNASNSETIRLDPTSDTFFNGGNVGIGTSSPVANTPLTLQAASGYTDTLWLKSAGTNIASRINIAPTGTGNAQINNTTGTAIEFQTSGAERMRIRADGEVEISGIGNVTGARLNVGSDANNAFARSYDTAQGLIVGTANATPLKILTNSLERMRIDSSGLVGIGTTSPQSVASGYGALTIGGTSGGGINFNSTGSAFGQIYGNNTQLSISAFGSRRITFNTNGSERARINSLGNLLVGTTTPGEGISYGTDGVTTIKGAYGAMIKSTGGDGYEALSLWNEATSGTIYQIIFRDGASGSVRGSVTTNGVTTAYNISSDYRLKNVDGPITNSGAYIDALKPVEGSWKADGSRFIGLIAHEVQEVSETQIATGEKDGEEMQGMDYSAPELIANLIAEIQSLRARVAQLEGV